MSSKSGFQYVYAFAHATVCEITLFFHKTLLRGKGWIVPNYGAPPAEEDVEMLRVVGKQAVT